MRPDTLSISLYIISSLLLSPFFFFLLLRFHFITSTFSCTFQMSLESDCSRTTNQSIPLFCPFLFPHTYFNSVLYVRDDQRNDSVLLSPGRQHSRDNPRGA